MKNTTKAPLPFAGQKRNWVKPLTEILSKLPPNTVFIDVFGGSGLVAHLCKELHPEARVVYNDYDNYSERLAHIQETEELRIALLDAFKNIERLKRINDREKLCAIVQSHHKKYKYVDWITLSSWVLFTNRFARSVDDLKKEGLWNCVSRTALSAASAERWLEGLEIVSLDWKEVVDRYKNSPNVLFIFDPPYLATVCRGYSKQDWGIAEYKELLALMPKECFLYFSSRKMDYIPLLNTLVPHWGGKSPFLEAKIFERSSTCGANTENPEILYYKL